MTCLLFFFLFIVVRAYVLDLNFEISQEIYRFPVIYADLTTQGFDTGSDHFQPALLRLTSAECNLDIVTTVWPQNQRYAEWHVPTTGWVAPALDPGTASIECSDATVTDASGTAPNLYTSPETLEVTGTPSLFLTLTVFTPDECDGRSGAAVAQAWVAVASAWVKGGVDGSPPANRVSALVALRGNSDDSVAEVEFDAPAKELAFDGRGAGQWEVRTVKFWRAENPDRPAPRFRYLGGDSYLHFVVGVKVNGVSARSRVQFGAVRQSSFSTRYHVDVDEQHVTSIPYSLGGYFYGEMAQRQQSAVVFASLPGGSVDWYSKSGSVNCVDDDAVVNDSFDSLVEQSLFGYRTPWFTATGICALPLEYSAWPVVRPRSFHNSLPPFHWFPLAPKEAMISRATLPSVRCRPIQPGRGEWDCTTSSSSLPAVEEAHARLRGKAWPTTVTLEDPGRVLDALGDLGYSRGVWIRPPPYPEFGGIRNDHVSFVHRALRVARCGGVLPDWTGDGQPPAPINDIVNMTNSELLLAGVLEGGKALAGVSFRLDDGDTIARTEITLSRVPHASEGSVEVTWRLRVEPNHRYQEKPSVYLSSDCDDPGSGSGCIVALAGNKIYLDSGLPVYAADVWGNVRGVILEPKFLSSSHLPERDQPYIVLAHRSFLLIGVVLRQMSGTIDLCEEPHELYFLKVSGDHPVRVMTPSGMITCTAPVDHNPDDSPRYWNTPRLVSRTARPRVAATPAYTHFVSKGSTIILNGAALPLASWVYSVFSSSEAGTAFPSILAVPVPDVVSLGGIHPPPADLASGIHHDRYTILDANDEAPLLTTDNDQWLLFEVLLAGRLPQLSSFPDEVLAPDSTHQRGRVVIDTVVVRWRIGAFDLSGPAAGADSLFVYPGRLLGICGDWAFVLEPGDPDASGNFRSWSRIIARKIDPEPLVSSRSRLTVSSDYSASQPYSTFGYGAGGDDDPLRWSPDMAASFVCVDPESGHAAFAATGVIVSVRPRPAVMSMELLIAAVPAEPRSRPSVFAVDSAVFALVQPGFFRYIAVRHPDAPHGGLPLETGFSIGPQPRWIELTWPRPGSTNDLDPSNNPITVTVDGGEYVAESFAPATQGYSGSGGCPITMLEGSHDRIVLPVGTSDPELSEHLSRLFELPAPRVPHLEMKPAGAIVRAAYVRDVRSDDGRAVLAFTSEAIIDFSRWDGSPQHPCGFSVTALGPLHGYAAFTNSARAWIRRRLPERSGRSDTGDGTPTCSVSPPAIALGRPAHERTLVLRASAPAFFEQHPGQMEHYPNEERAPWDQRVTLRISGTRGAVFYGRLERNRETGLVVLTEAVVPDDVLSRFSDHDRLSLPASFPIEVRLRVAEADFSLPDDFDEDESNEEKWDWLDIGCTLTFVPSDARLSTVLPAAVPSRLAREVHSTSTGTAVTADNLLITVVGEAFPYVDEALLRVSFSPLPAGTVTFESASTVPAVYTSARDGVIAAVPLFSLAVGTEAVAAGFAVLEVRVSFTAQATTTQDSLTITAFDPPRIFRVSPTAVPRGSAASWVEISGHNIAVGPGDTASARCHLQTQRRTEDGALGAVTETVPASPVYSVRATSVVPHRSGAVRCHLGDDFAAFLDAVAADAFPLQLAVHYAPDGQTFGAATSSDPAMALLRAEVVSLRAVQPLSAAIGVPFPVPVQVAIYTTATNHSSVVSGAECVFSVANVTNTSATSMGTGAVAILPPFPGGGGSSSSSSGLESNTTSSVSATTTTYTAVYQHGGTDWYFQRAAAPLGPGWIFSCEIPAALASSSRAGVYNIWACLSRSNCFAPSVPLSAFVLPRVTSVSPAVLLDVADFTIIVRFESAAVLSAALGSPGVACTCGIFDAQKGAKLAEYACRVGTPGQAASAAPDEIICVHDTPGGLTSGKDENAVDIKVSFDGGVSYPGSALRVMVMTSRILEVLTDLVMSDRVLITGFPADSARGMTCEFTNVDLGLAVAQDDQVVWTTPVVIDPVTDTISCAVLTERAAGQGPLALAGVRYRSRSRSALLVRTANTTAQAANTTFVNTSGNTTAINNGTIGGGNENNTASENGESDGSPSSPGGAGTNTTDNSSNNRTSPSPPSSMWPDMMGLPTGSLPSLPADPTSSSPGASEYYLRIVDTLRVPLSRPRRLVIAPRSNVSSIDPISGPQSGGQVVTVRGDGFVGTSQIAVRWGDSNSSNAAASTDITFLSATMLLARTPHVPAGRVPVSVLVNGVDPAFPFGATEIVFTFEPCAEGSESENSAISCRPCAPGYFKSSMSQAMCTPCSPDSFADAPGSTTCTGCAAGRSIRGLADSHDKCMCDSGFYLHPADRGGSNRTTACRRCPEGATCAGNLAPPVARPGFWVSPSNPEFALQCDSLAACPGGPPGAACPLGYEGTRCAVCSEGYYRGSDFSCSVCDGRGTAMFVLAVFAAVALLALSLLWVGDRPDAFAGWFFIAAHFFQSLSLLMSFKSLHWPRLALNITNWITFPFAFDVSIFRSECAGIPYTTMWYITVSAPLWLAVTFAVMGLALRTAAGKERSARRVSNAYFFCLNLFFTRIVSRALEVPACTVFPDGTVSMDASPGIECSVSRAPYTGLFVGCVLSLLVMSLAYVAAVPMWLRWKRGVLDTREFAERYSSLYGQFARRSYAWVGTVSLERLALAGLAVLAGPARAARAGGMVVVTFASVGLHAAEQPYARAEDNVLAVVTRWALVPVMVSALVLEGRSVTEVTPEITFLVNAVVLVTVFVSTLVLTVVALNRALSPAAAILPQKLRDDLREATTPAGETRLLDCASWVREEERAREIAVHMISPRGPWGSLPPLLARWTTPRFAARVVLFLEHLPDLISVYAATWGGLCKSCTSCHRYRSGLDGIEGPDLSRPPDEEKVQPHPRVRHVTAGARRVVSSFTSRSFSSRARAGLASVAVERAEIAGASCRVFSAVAKREALASDWGIYSSVVRMPVVMAARVVTAAVGLALRWVSPGGKKPKPRKKSDRVEPFREGGDEIARDREDGHGVEQEAAGLEADKNVSGSMRLRPTSSTGAIDDDRSSPVRMALASRSTSISRGVPESPGTATTTGAAAGGGSALIPGTLGTPGTPSAVECRFGGDSTGPASHALQVSQSNLRRRQSSGRYMRDTNAGDESDDSDVEFCDNGRVDFVGPGEYTYHAFIADLDVVLEAVNEQVELLKRETSKDGDDNGGQDGAARGTRSTRNGDDITAGLVAHALYGPAVTLFDIHNGLTRPGDAAIAKRLLATVPGTRNLHTLPTNRQPTIGRSGSRLRHRPDLGHRDSSLGPRRSMPVLPRDRAPPREKYAQRSGQTRLPPIAGSSGTSAGPQFTPQPGTLRATISLKEAL